MVKISSIFLQSFFTLKNDHVPKATHVKGRNTQLAILSPALIPALATIAPDSKVISPAVGKDFTITPPT